MTTWAIGDLQGCYDPLQRLLEKIRFDTARDRLWFCGDLVNRGGKSLETLRLVHSLDVHSTVVLGNHDLALVAIHARKDREKRKVNPDLERVLIADDRDRLIDWLRHRPLIHVDHGLSWVLVHAGLAPKWNESIAENRAHEVERVLRGKNYKRLLRGMFGDRPQWSPKLRGIERYRAIINIFTRMRYCSTEGKVAFDCKGAPGTQRAGLYPWFETPGRKLPEHRLVFGHWSTLGLLQGYGIHGIDTGCVWGGKLTALELTPPGELPRVVQVQGRSLEPGESRKED